MASSALWAALCLAACSSQSAPPHNVASGSSSQVAQDQPLGWIGIAPRPSGDPADWIPAGTQSVLVPMPADGLAAGATLSAIDTRGRVTRVTATAATKVPYGCDNHQLDVLAFTGDKSAPGAVWLLPPTAPALWHPSALAIVSPVAATATRRRDTIGPLALELVRGDATHGTLTIARDGRVLHSAANAGVAIPQPVAAWSVVDGGPILLVLQVPSYEGVHLTPILVEADHARELPAMAAYLYQCAN
jgi:hypothetical protein